MVVCSVAFLTTISLALSMAFTIESFANLNQFNIRIDEAQNKFHFSLNILGTKIVSIISAAILIPLVALVYQLVGFHALLLKDGITTYEFIVREQRKMRELKQIELHNASRPLPRGQISSNANDSEIAIEHINIDEEQAQHENKVESNIVQSL